MKEVNIAVNIKNGEYLEYIKSNLENEHTKIYSAITVIGNMAILSIVTSDDDFFLIEIKLKQLIADVVLFIYKEQFLKDNINFSNLTENYKMVLLKALVLFDSDSDKVYIKSKIKFNKDIYLESFFNFQLKALKQRWQEFVNITNENSNLLESNAFLDLLKFLITTIKPKMRLVNVYFNGSSFEFKDKNLRQIKNTLIKNDNDEATLITTLITLAPNTINLHCISSLSNNTFKILYYIFDKRINLLV